MTVSADCTDGSLLRKMHPTSLGIDGEYQAAKIIHQMSETALLTPSHVPIIRKVASPFTPSDRHPKNNPTPVASLKSPRWNSSILTSPTQQSLSMPPGCPRHKVQHFSSLSLHTHSHLRIQMRFVFMLAILVKCFQGIGACFGLLSASADVLIKPPTQALHQTSCRGRYSVTFCYNRYY